MTTDSLTVFWYALLTALATGVGAAPFLFVRKIPRLWLGLANAAAAGLMLAASFSLIYEGAAFSLVRTVLGILAGLIFIQASDHFLQRYKDLEVFELKGADARKVLLILSIMTIHSLTEGIGVGVSFGGEEKLGIFVTLAIAIHNIPEGLAICLVMIPRGASVTKGCLWSIVSSLPQPLMAVPAFLFVAHFFPFLPVGLGFAAGAMIWMVFSELIPDANQDASPSAVGAVVTFSIAAMLIFQHLIKA